MSIGKLDDLLSPSDPAGKRKLLVVDDRSEIIQGIASSSLGRSYEIVAAANGREGLERLAADHEIGVVLLDMRMPVMTGEEFLRELRADRDRYNPWVRVIVHTAFAGHGVDQADVLKTYGPVRFLTKATDPSIIAVEVANAYTEFDRESGRLRGLLLFLSPREGFRSVAARFPGYEPRFFTDAEALFDDAAGLIHRGERIAYLCIDSSGGGSGSEALTRVRSAFPVVKSGGEFGNGTPEEESRLEEEIREAIEWLERRQSRPWSTRSLKGRHILVDGVTGFLGPHVVRRILEQDPDAMVYVIGRGDGDRTLSERLRNKALMSERIQLLEGTLERPDLGLDPSGSPVLKRIEEIWHIAGTTSFDRSAFQHSFVVNVLGTAHLLALATELPRLRCFNHISTAYVCGRTHFPDLVYETVRLPGSGFRLPYESSKAMAELSVIHSGLPYRIFRPSIIVGDLETGESDTKVLYGAAEGFKRVWEAMLAAGDKYGLHVLGEPGVMKNIVPVNYVREMMMGVRESDVGLGRIYHVTNPVPTPMQEVLQAITDMIGMPGVLLANPLDPPSMSSWERLLARGLRGYEGYMLVSDPAFSRVNTDRDHPRPCPEIGRPELDLLLKDFFHGRREGA